MHKIKFPQSSVARAGLASFAVLLIGVAAFFAGRSAEARYEERVEAQSPTENLVKQGLYDQAVQSIRDETRNGEREETAGTDMKIATVYLEGGRADIANRERWAREAVTYLDKAASSVTRNDPLDLESLMDDFNMAGDFSENGCPDYEKAIGFGEASLSLLQGDTFQEPNDKRSRPTQPMRDELGHRLDKIREKVKAWCKK